ncbi:unnamed protein product [Spirodela intermedia]|uniref:Uncharacterized protein n=1 Tax=Spirodela intermedia TaxID=51605 RepID=A0A7I8IP56_SPIIN|nr:unnamed protein product [Spirodela intermedia]CAA6659589.1 unnamed protein product [Spirodela intermedia]
MWLQHEDFQSFVRNHWYGHISDSPMENLSYRLRNLKLHLKWWNRHIYGNVHTQVDALQKELAKLKDYCKLDIQMLLGKGGAFGLWGLHIIPTQTWTTIRSVRWTPPRVGQWKLNVDGASQGNPGPSGGGGILRDSRMHSLCLFKLL